MNQDRCEGEKEMNQSVRFNEKEKKILEALYNKEGVRNWESMTKQGQREWANLMDGVLTREVEEEVEEEVERLKKTGTIITAQQQFPSPPLPSRSRSRNQT